MEGEGLCSKFRGIYWYSWVFLSSLLLSLYETRDSDLWAQTLYHTDKRRNKLDLKVCLTWAKHTHAHTHTRTPLIFKLNYLFTLYPITSSSPHSPQERPVPERVSNASRQPWLCFPSLRNTCCHRLIWKNANEGLAPGSVVEPCQASALSSDPAPENKLEGWKTKIRRGFGLA